MFSTPSTFGVSEYTVLSLLLAPPARRTSAPLLLDAKLHTASLTGSPSLSTSRSTGGGDSTSGVAPSDGTYCAGRLPATSSASCLMDTTCHTVDTGTPHNRHDSATDSVDPGAPFTASTTDGVSVLLPPSTP